MKNKTTEKRIKELEEKIEIMKLEIEILKKQDSYKELPKFMKLSFPVNINPKDVWFCSKG